MPKFRKLKQTLLYRQLTRKGFPDLLDEKLKKAYFNGMSGHKYVYPTDSMEWAAYQAGLSKANCAKRNAKRYGEQQRGICD